MRARFIEDLNWYVATINKVEGIDRFTVVFEGYKKPFSCQRGSLRPLNSWLEATKLNSSEWMKLRKSKVTREFLYTVYEENHQFQQMKWHDISLLPTRVYIWPHLWSCFERISIRGKDHFFVLIVRVPWTVLVVKGPVSLADVWEQSYYIRFKALCAELDKHYPLEELATITDLTHLEQNKPGLSSLLLEVDSDRRRRKYQQKEEYFRKLEGRNVWEQFLGRWYDLESWRESKTCQDLTLLQKKGEEESSINENEGLEQGLGEKRLNLDELESDLDQILEFLVSDEEDSMVEISLESEEPVPVCSFCSLAFSW